MKAIQPHWPCLGAAAVAISFLVVPVLAACGGGRAGTNQPIGRSRLVPPADEPIDLELRTTDGERLSLASLRGRPVLVFLLATFDTASQAALTPLRRFVDAHEDVAVVGVAVQPGADRLAGAWKDVLAVPFVVAWDPAGRILEGSSALGRVEGVPSYVAIDRRGVIVARHAGLADGRVLEALLREMRRGR
jgi:cytochrome oxidase Cu insertion factor (SCO1/SenC/PrrC family)